MTVTVAFAVDVAFFTDVAVIVTLPAVAGAVYTVAAPLAVCVGLKLPQAPAGAQLHVTPLLLESCVTVATIDAVRLISRELGGAVEMVTTGGVEFPHAESNSIDATASAVNSDFRFIAVLP